MIMPYFMTVPPSAMRGFGKAGIPKAKIPAA